MVIYYDYTEGSRRPPSNYSVQIETEDELRRTVGYLVARLLNEGESTHRLEVGLGVAPRYERRRVMP